MFKSFAKGLLFGTVVGGASGLLFAPRSGQETKEKLVAGIDDTTKLVTDVNDGLQHLQTAFGEVKDTLNALVPEFQEGLRKDVTDYQFQIEPRLEQVNQQVNLISRHLGDALNSDSSN